MKPIDIIILILVILIVGLILFFNIRRLKQDKSGCSSCPYKSNCSHKHCSSTKEEPKANATSEKLENISTKQEHKNNNKDKNLNKNSKKDVN